MIHHKHPGLVFVHIPKTAGTSIEIMLARLLFGVGHPDELPRTARVKMHLPVRGIDGQHAKFSEHRLEGPVDPYFAFSIVRHPLARAVSQVAYLRQWDPGRRFFGGKCWKDWLMKLASTRRAMIWGHDLGACQVDYLIDSEGRLAMDFIGRFEQLDAAWERCGIHPSADAGGHSIRSAVTRPRRPAIPRAARGLRRWGWGNGSRPA